MKDLRLFEVDTGFFTVMFYASTTEGKSLRLSKSDAGFSQSASSRVP